jgi:hypothetical protein
MQHRRSLKSFLKVQRSLGGLTMDCSQRSSSEGVKRNRLHTGKRANRLTEIIVLILTAAAAIALLVSATLALVNLN